MGNIKHYIHGISSGSEFFTLEKKLKFACSVLTLFHVVLSLTMFFSGVTILCAYNVVSVLFYGVIIHNLIAKNNLGTAVIITICEVTLCSFISTLCIGFDSGFSLYNIAMIAGIFYTSFVVDTFKKKEVIPLASTLFFAACHILNYVLSLFMQPLYSVKSESWIHFFYIFNSIVSFSMMIIFSILLLWELKVSNSKLSSQNEQLDEMAHRDPLTQLYNRRSMNQFLDSSMEKLKKNGKRFSLILGDIDDFKKVNDTYGHDAGDIVLTRIAQIISSNVRDNDYVCRWGGEEILILINDPVETAAMAAERIRKTIEDASIIAEGQSLKITMTFGISESIPGYKLEQLIQQADDKLYQGKQAGKNRVVS